EFVKEEFGVEADFPFADKTYKTTPVFRHKGNKKWFALGMDIPLCKLTGKDDKVVFVVNVKADLMFKTAMLENVGVYPAYHMNKEHWLSICIEQASRDVIETLVEMSFDLTKEKFKKKKD
ncbi:MAG: MmcQ/YjbR family DNA-binding protein, partial [Clostridia bacterium]|nr:MmcQ/YjbR family DNA-binding protein [Clostridia bacterium]